MEGFGFTVESDGPNEDFSYPCEPDSAIPGRRGCSLPSPGGGSGPGFGPARLPAELTEGARLIERRVCELAREPDAWLLALGGTADPNAGEGFLVGSRGIVNVPCVPLIVHFVTTPYGVFVGTHGRVGRSGDDSNTTIAGTRKYRLDEVGE